MEVQVVLLHSLCRQDLRVSQSVSSNKTDLKMANFYPLVSKKNSLKEFSPKRKQRTVGYSFSIWDGE